MAGSGFKLENEGTLPPGAATEATLAIVAGDTTSIDGKTPADPAREGGNLATVAADTTSIDGKIPADPAREGGNLAVVAGDTTSIDGKLPTSLGPKAATGSLSVTPPPNQITMLPDVTTIAGGGAGSSTFTLVAGGIYELEVCPDYSAGAADSDTVRGVYKEAPAPADDNDGWFIRYGMTRTLCYPAGAVIHVRAHNLGVIGRWKCRRLDA